MASKKCFVFVKAFVAEPGSSSGFGVFETRIPCGRIRWDSDRPQRGFRPRVSDFYQVHLGVCEKNEEDEMDCPHTTADFDVRGGSFKRRRK